MKRLATAARYLLAGTLLGPMACWAGTWSSCQTISALTDYTANNASFYLNLTPGISGCVADTNGGAIVRYTSLSGPVITPIDTYKNLFATAALAYASGKQVQLYYDNTSSPPACLVTIISIGGTSNQCN